jgi:uncharacterized protein
MLRVDVRELRRGPVETVGSVSPDDPVLEGLEVSLKGPLRVTGQLEGTPQGDFLWHGHLSGQVEGNCRRCLKDLVLNLEQPVEALFSADPDLADDPSVYPLTEPVGHVDVTAAVREEMALAVSAYPLCKEDCAGLCPKCGSDLNLGPCDCSGSV